MWLQLPIYSVQEGSEMLQCSGKVIVYQEHVSPLLFMSLLKFNSSKALKFFMQWCVGGKNGGSLTSYKFV